MRKPIVCFTLVSAVAIACGSSDDGSTGAGVDGGNDGNPIDSGAPFDSGVITPTDSGSGDAGHAQSIQRGCATAAPACYTVYAHSADTLYFLDQTTKTLVTVGAFQAPIPDGGVAADSIIDLAVTPDDTVWVVSTTALYRADTTTGHVTLVSPIGACGAGNIALASDTTGHLYLGDSVGDICPLDRTTTPATVGAAESLGGGLALAGDFAVVSDGTAYATVFTLATPSTQLNDTLATLNLSTGAATTLASATGYPKLFGVAYGGSHVLAFSHDGSGDAVVIDPTTGVGMLYNVLTDPTSGVDVSFEGAGVNPLVTK